MPDLSAGPGERKNGTEVRGCGSRGDFRISGGDRGFLQKLKKLASWMKGRVPELMKVITLRITEFGGAMPE